MERPSKSPLVYPFTGTGYFLSHPALWWLQIVAMLLLLISLMIVFCVILYFTWPHSSSGLWHISLGILKALGLGSAGALVGFVFFMPFFLTIALDKLVRKMYLKEHGEIVNVSFFKSAYSSTLIFFRTIFWRIFWPVVGILAAIFLGPLGVFIAQLGIGHLAVIDGVDLALALKGYDTSFRMQCYKEKRLEIFKMGFSAALLSLMLSVTILGWLIWVPGVIAGCALWVNDWPLKGAKASLEE